MNWTVRISPSSNEARVRSLMDSLAALGPATQRSPYRNEPRDVGGLVVHPTCSRPVLGLQDRMTPRTPVPTAGEIPRLRNTTSTLARELRHVLRGDFPHLSPIDLYRAARTEGHSRLLNLSSYRYASYDARRHGPTRAWERTEEKRIFLELMRKFPSLSLKKLTKVMNRGRHLSRVDDM